MSIVDFYSYNLITAELSHQKSVIGTRVYIKIWVRIEPGPVNPSIWVKQLDPYFFRSLRSLCQMKGNQFILLKWRPLIQSKIQSIVSHGQTVFTGCVIAFRINAATKVTGYLQLMPHVKKDLTTHNYSEHPST